MEKIYDFLDQVEKPGRYVGNEYNQVIKSLDKVDVRFAFAFPDLYEIGMSHLGLQILYGALNQMENVWCERVFAVATDMEQKLRENHLPIFSLESKTPISKFDFVGFTLQYELSYTNILNILDLGEIPLMSKDRNENHPLVVFGGPCAYNSEPVADFADIILLGEGEEQLPELMKLYSMHKSKGYKKTDFLIDAAKNIQGVYIPSFYEVNYKEDGTILDVLPTIPGIPAKIEKRIIRDMDNVFFPVDLIVPNIEIVHARIMLEIFRGCTRGCRFCQAGMIYRPIREKSIEKLLELSQKISESTGYEEMSLSSLSSSDYSQINQLFDTLNQAHEKNMLSISLPSLRLDNFSLEIAEKSQKVKKSGLTFAPEAGSQRLRDVINKNVTKMDLQNTLTQAFSNGWKKIKLYFMIGLPTETYEDLDGIVEMAYFGLDCYKKINDGKIHPRVNITISSSCFVPKPFTPYQWVAQDTMDQLKEKQLYLKDRLKHKNLSFHYHDYKTSFLEGVFARGDRRLSAVLKKAFELGCKFDSWHEHFNFEKWMEAFQAENIDMSFYANRERSYQEVLPWDHIDVGVDKNFLIQENQYSKIANTSIDCRENCLGCGLNTNIGRGLCG